MKLFRKGSSTEESQGKKKKNNYENYIHKDQKLKLLTTIDIADTVISPIGEEKE